GRRMPARLCGRLEISPQPTHEDGREDSRRNVADSLSRRQPEVVPGALSEQGRMGARDLVRGPTVRVVVERERFARHSLRAAKRGGMPVVGEVRGAKDHVSINRGQDLPLAARHAGFQHSKVTAVFLAPVLVEVDEKVEPPIEVEAWVPVEVGMNTELSATH